ncbi:MAG: ribosome biogenesis GTPase YlqF [Clostridia bacterium]|jgi:ribosome biogenesis GTPase A
MNIQWFPGHMARTIRILSENLKLVDVVIELLDARIPSSSKNPDIDKITNNKKKIIVLNKSDLADDALSVEWSRWYRKQGYECIFVDSISGKGINELKVKLREMMKEKLEREKSKGRIFTPIRTMVVGVPNVGKSSFINRISGRAIAATGDKPGVTRSKLWIKINREIELMDTPGILWPKFDDPVVGQKLAYTGAIKDDIMDTVELASSLLEFFKSNYPDRIIERYKLTPLENKDGEEILLEAGKNRGCIISGGEINQSRISAIILDEFRGGKLGKITLESPKNQQK